MKTLTVYGMILIAGSGGWLLGHFGQQKTQGTATEVSVWKPDGKGLESVTCFADDAGMDHYFVVPPISGQPYGSIEVTLRSPNCQIRGSAVFDSKSGLE